MKKTRDTGGTKESEFDFSLSRFDATYTYSTMITEISKRYIVSQPNLKRFIKRKDPSFDANPSLSFFSLDKALSVQCGSIHLEYNNKPNILQKACSSFLDEKTCPCDLDCTPLFLCLGCWSVPTLWRNTSSSPS